MNFLVAAWYEFLKNIRDIKMLAFMVVFPITISYIIGSAVQGYFKPDNGNVIQAAYVNLDTGAAGNAFDKFLSNPDIAKRLKTAKYQSLEEGRAALDEGRATVLIHIPAGFTEGLIKGESRKVQLSGNSGLEFVTMLASSFASTFNANMAVMQTGGTPVQVERANSVTRVDRTKNGEFPTLTDYYAVLVLLQALIIGAIFGAYVTARNYGSDIHIRIHALPVNSSTLLFGRIVGSVAYLLMTSAATILFTSCVYGVNWGGNPLIIAGALAVFCFISVGLGVICGRLFKKISTSMMIVFVLMFFFGTVSGSVSPRSGTVALGFLTPNYYAKLLLFGSIYGYPAQTMLNSALWLLAFAAAVSLAVVALTRRGRYDNI